MDTVEAQSHVAPIVLHWWALQYAHSSRNYPDERPRKNLLLFRALSESRRFARLGLPRVDDASIRDLFLAFVGRMDMSSSYKPVLLLAIFDNVDERGQVRIEDVVLGFHNFYLDRLHRGLPAELAGMRMQQADHLSKDDVRVGPAPHAISKLRAKEIPLIRKQDLAYIRFQALSGASSRSTISRQSGVNANKPSRTTMSVKQADHCPFCTVPPDRILELREHALLLLDAYPVSPGHSLVISRRHIAEIFDLTATEIGDILELVELLGRIDRTLQPTGYNIGVNIGTDAGQTVMHVHIHVIPRYRGDSDDPTGGVRGVIPGKAKYAESNGPIWLPGAPLRAYWACCSARVSGNLRCCLTTFPVSTVLMFDLDSRPAIMALPSRDAYSTLTSRVSRRGAESLAQISLDRSRGDVCPLWPALRGRSHERGRTSRSSAGLTRTLGTTPIRDICTDLGPEFRCGGELLGERNPLLL